MKPPRLLGAATLLIFGVGLAVFGYNVWAYSCGHCTLQTLYSFGPFGFLLLGLTAIAGLSLLWLRRRRLQKGAARCCPCGAPRHGDWAFCPHCGKAVSAVARAH